jgi:hypothetical protein
MYYVGSRSWILTGGVFNYFIRRLSLRTIFPYSVGSSFSFPFQQTAYLSCLFFTLAQMA